MARAADSPLKQDRLSWPCTSTSRRTSEKAGRMFFWLARVTAFSAARNVSCETAIIGYLLWNYLQISRRRLSTWYSPLIT
ncbi:MAG: hypothetical protein IANPNBLG_03525 [Bryobacteraceae bacterium]|nr:hypothetical protein [Bryobacteraceae bacterium]